jgi:exoribonuclease-2
LAKGAVIMNFPEVKLRATGDVEGGHVRRLDAVVAEQIPQTGSRRLVQELMILAGSVAGSYCSVNKVPVVFRVQPAPTDPTDLQQLAGKRHELVDAWRLRRKMPRSQFQGTPDSHFGLGLDAYVQATSPIRRYGDLVCHRQIRAALAGEPYLYDDQTMMEVINQVATTTHASNAVDRESNRYWSLVWLAARVGVTLDGVVVGFAGRKADRANVHLSDLASVQTVPLAHKVALGDSVRVQVDSVQPRQDKVSLRMVAD